MLQAFYQNLQLLYSGNEIDQNNVLPIEFINVDNILGMKMVVGSSIGTMLTLNLSMLSALPVAIKQLLRMSKMVSSDVMIQLSSIIDVLLALT